MIKVELAKNGLAILKKNGKLLASSVDPIREAASWVARVCEKSKPNEIMIVLGLGSGYHVVELMKCRPVDSFIIIESDIEILRETLKIFPALSAIKIIVEPDWQKLIENHVFKDAVGGVYQIAIHGATGQIDSVYICAVESLLLGREKPSFLLLLKARPDLLGIFNPSAIENLSDELVSIKTVSQLFGPKSLASRERRLWRVLEELVV